MPTYDYRCKSCGCELEYFQSMTEAPKRKCPECGKNTLERLIGTGAAIVFKGSGFYQTDYRSESYKKAAEADSKPAESKAADTKADKPAADKAAKPEKPEKPSEPAKPAEKSRPAIRVPATSRKSAGRRSKK